MTTTEMQELTTEQWSEVLVQSLPYFKQWCGKVVVVKYGGNAMLNEELKEAVMDDIVLLSTIGIKVVLVHGGGPEINHMLERVGKESKFIDGLRYTDAETMEIVQMVLTGKLNKDIVGILLQKRGKAVGISGVDSGLLRAVDDVQCEAHRQGLLVRPGKAEGQQALVIDPIDGHGVSRFHIQYVVIIVGRGLKVRQVRLGPVVKVLHALRFQHFPDFAGTVLRADRSQVPGDHP